MKYNNAESVLEAISRPLMLVMLLGVVSLAFWVEPVLAAPKAELWEKWAVSNEANSVNIDHSAWQNFLDKYLKKKGDPEVTRFDYGSVSDADKQVLKQYIDRLQQTPILTFSKAEQMAYWINLYNAVTVNLILDHYPVESIRKIKFGFFSFGPWDEKLISVDGESLSLNDIEHRILRPIWQDNRIHYAVNCASIGCPNLAPQAYTAENTNALLAEGAEHYVNHPRGVAYTGDDLVLSSIYDWYQVDFGGTEEGVIEHLKKFARPELAERLNGHHGDIEYEYDWGLNLPE